MNAFHQTFAVEWFLLLAFWPNCNVLFYYGICLACNKRQSIANQQYSFNLFYKIIQFSKYALFHLWPHQNQILEMAVEVAGYLMQSLVVMPNVRWLYVTAGCLHSLQSIRLLHTILGGYVILIVFILHCWMVIFHIGCLYIISSCHNSLLLSVWRLYSVWWLYSVWLLYIVGFTQYLVVIYYSWLSS